MISKANIFFRLAEVARKYCSNILKSDVLTAIVSPDCRKCRIPDKGHIRQQETDDSEVVVR
ncbi:hypothetical protein M3B74_14860 [Citrobacter freundii]|uniref:hypothetical protein n=1 Tax=Citrobacter freundii TaxID=546 RepID=UPI00223AF077|nr:hypothetical protein [Citrobacter freundii]MCT1467922.1 hypothetical protein [Citrobacter freundii]MCT1496297.1 hypothetical protein [Citrobacter freundii]